ncbi:2-C-methyl-D-erythritol 4-phosphate cytidylyltransferase [Pseudomonas sp. ok272]|uniref:IspD/TarI family cytidylyltransferase n=1 Tax=unclassified Pseudomonas TaxID=196821 RepID=UPI0008CC72D5|nr:MULTISPECIES: IspD/TarI family cytidylyltransferase [unclassified Pseudomonas]SEM99363.1 2-C-methyl-D-erythritol 4-phosphate cytidylyltransferase [Pseudomonas sp. ok272]SFM89839.1 2-C-methyl-D-erythritol 4-phosphate cytidylyltransferase [Pseudomonas sp. ok602]
MNTALIFAGGTGQRMNSRTRPKQFLELHGKPIIIYTLEHFEAHPDINSIVVVCLEEWIPYLQNLLAKFNINKVISIVPGGTSGQDSIYRGLRSISERCPKDTVVLIHDGVRPLINAKLISDNIDSVLANGSAITVSKAIETIILTSQDKVSNEILDRNYCEVAKAPQSFYLKDILSAHLKAIECGETDMIDSATLMQWFEKPLHSVLYESINIKITTPIDFYIFRAILDSREDTQLYGLE